jgi:hypothetical protein
MPHYVNIAWGCFFLACLFVFGGWGGSLDFAFYLKNQYNIKKQNTMCRMCAGLQKA